MATEKSPCFQLYPREFMADLHVQAMDWTGRGIYVWLLCLCWCEGSVPADIEAIAPIFAGIRRADFDRHWARIAPCFVERDGSFGALAFLNKPRSNPPHQRMKAEQSLDDNVNRRR